jgi:hypothetical protein
MHHHKSRHRPPVPGSARRGAAHPELTFPNPMTWSSPHRAQPGQAKDTTKHNSDQLPVRDYGDLPGHLATLARQTVSFNGPRTRETHHPHTRPAPRLRTARRARPTLPPETSTSQPAARTRRPRRPEPSQRNQDHISFGLTGRVVCRMMSALLRPRSETFRPAALPQARTALRSAGEPPGRLAPRRRPPRGARRPASMKGASAFFSLDRFFLPRSIS